VSAAALAAEGVVKRYGGALALGGVSLTVRPGELFGLLGPNGAGKSTLVKIACGLVRASEGRVAICGEPAGSRAANARLGYLAELFRFPEWLRAREVLELHQELAGSGGGAAEAERLLALVGLADAAERRVAELSKGSAIRACCCSTSRRARSTPPAATSCASCSRGCASAASRSSSPRTC
jgi:ABC-2 type transport system ATP-binding protein